LNIAGTFTFVIASPRLWEDVAISAFHEALRLLRRRAPNNDRTDQRDPLGTGLGLPRNSNRVTIEDLMIFNKNRVYFPRYLRG